MVGYCGPKKYFCEIGHHAQPNVCNAHDQSDPIHVSTCTNGPVYRYATVEPSLFIVASGFEF